MLSQEPEGGDAFLSRLMKAGNLRLEMDTDKSWVQFVRNAVVVGTMARQDGRLYVLRLDRPVWTWSPLPKRIRVVAVKILGPYYRRGVAGLEPTGDKLYVDVFGVKGRQTEHSHGQSPDERWTLAQPDLIAFGPADLLPV